MNRIDINDPFVKWLKSRKEIIVNDSYIVSNTGNHSVDSSITTGDSRGDNCVEEIEE